MWLEIFADTRHEEAPTPLWKLTAVKEVLDKCYGNIHTHDCFAQHCYLSYLSRGFNECYLNTHRTRQLLRDNIATVQPVTILYFLFLKAHWVKGWIIPKSAASFFARM